MDLAGERQAARALVGGLGADHRIGDARDIVVLHVLADAAQLMHDRHADPAEMLPGSAARLYPHNVRFSPRSTRTRPHASPSKPETAGTAFKKAFIGLVSARSA